jgi:hypothetical protein
VTEELGRDIVARLRHIAVDVRPGLRLPYDVISVEFTRTGTISALDEPAVGPPGAICRISVRVRDTRTGEITPVDFADWPVGDLLATGAGAEAQRSAFAWLLHANLDEWWLAGRHG